MEAKYFYDKFLQYLEDRTPYCINNGGRDFSIHQKNDKHRLYSFLKNGEIVRRNLTVKMTDRVDISELEGDDFELYSIFKMYKVCFISNYKCDSQDALWDLYNIIKDDNTFTRINHTHDKFFKSDQITGLTFANGHNVWVDIKTAKDIDRENVCREALCYPAIPSIKYIDKNKSLEAIIYAYTENEITDKEIENTVLKLASYAKTALGKSEFIDLEIKPDFY